MPSTRDLESLSLNELQAIASKKAEQDPQTVIAVLEHIAERAFNSNDFQSMEHWYEELSNYAEVNKIPATHAFSLYKVGFARFLQDDYGKAILAYSEAEALYESLFDDSNYFECVRAKVDSYFAIQEYRTAISIGEELLEKSLSAEHYKLAGQISFVIAKCYEQLNYKTFSDLTDSFLEASEHFAEEARRYFENSGESALVAEVLAFQGDLDPETNLPRRLNSIQASISLFNESQKLTFHETVSLSDAYESQGRILIKMEKLKEAEASLRKSLDLYEGLYQENQTEFEFGYFGRRAVCLWQLSMIKRKQGKYEEALDLVNSAMDAGLYDAGEDFYYRLVQDQSWLLFQTDREMLAQRICDEGISKYEEVEEKPFDSGIYFGLLMQKAVILVWAELWEKTLEVLDKIQNINDYLVPMNRAIRIDVFRARALNGVGRESESLEILDSVLYDTSLEKIEDEDIAEAYELRGRILLGRGNKSGSTDIERAIEYYDHEKNGEWADELRKLLR